MTSVETEHELAGWAHLKSHKNHEAIKNFTEDLSTNLNARSFVGRSQAYFNLKEYTKATVDAKVALELDRTNVKAWYAFAHALLGAGKYEPCLAACHNGLEYVSDDPKLLQVQESCHRLIRGEPDEPAKKWGEGHDHAHAHAHGNEHGHDHGHAHGKGHGDAHDHKHCDVHTHDDHRDQECKHDHAHGHGAAHEHSHEHTHADHDESECKHDHTHELTHIKDALDHHHDHAHK